MSLLGNIVGHAAATVGRTQDYLTPGSGSGTLTDVGRAIYNPNSTLAYPGAINPFARGSAFKYQSSPSKVTNQNEGGAGQGYEQDTAASLGGYGGGAGGAASSDPRAAALYQQAIDQALGTRGRLDSQLGIGLGNIQGDYNSNLNRLLNAKNQTQAKYEGAQIDTNKDNIAARSDIDFATGQRANSLQRLLGSRGAGSSSAARVSAPYAAALEGTRRLNQVGDTFSENMGALDTSWGDYQNNWNQNREDLDAQKVNQERALRQDIDTRRSNLLESIAQLQLQKQQALGSSPGATVAAAQPYLDRVNALAPQIDSLGAQYQGKVNVADPTYKAPELGKYQYDARQAFDLGGGANARTESISPYLSLLLGADKKRQQNTLLG